MQLNLKSLFYVVIGFVISITGNATSTYSDQRITQAMKQFMRNHHVHGGAVIISRHGKMKTYLFGEAVPAKHIPVTENTIFELGSITKTFTGTLLAENVVLGKTNLTDPIQHYLDKPHSTALGKMTYLNIATHSSGLPFNAYNLPYNASFSSTHRLRFHHVIQNQRAHYRMETQMLYSNFGYGILGRALAKKSNTTLPVLMKRNILSPLNMTTSGLDIHPEYQKYLAQGYNAQGQPVAYQQSGLLGGAWAMRASVKDMRSYLRAALGSSTTPPALHRAIRLSQVPHYALVGDSMQLGLGWVITPLNHKNSAQQIVRRPEHYHFVPVRGIKIKNPHFNSHALVGKTGATDGFRAYIAMIPEKNTGVVIMINQFFHAGFSLTSMANKMLLEASV